jgi:hypothetical protein
MKGITMNNVKLPLNPETAAIFDKMTDLTGLNGSEIIRRRLAQIEMECVELLALAESYPGLRDEAANLMISYGPESILAGIQRIAPSGYLTLAASFERDLQAALGVPSAAH